MNSSTGKAAELARTYVDAMASKDVETILAMAASDVVCTSPMGQLIGIERFRDFQEGFARMITHLTVLAVYGDDEQAVVVYDVETQPVAHAVTAELIQVKDGQLISTDVIYDATPFAAYMASLQAH